jgi:folate-binding protein YgfZ
MIYHLPERCLIKISGEDAEAFLQSLVTQDMAGLEVGKLIYTCLLTPQGRFLHDFFIHKEGEDFFLECETQRREDLLRRLKIFKLRSKVVIEDCSAEFVVYAGEQGRFQDPRLSELGYRSYRHAADGRHPDSGEAAIYKGASRDQTPPTYALHTKYAGGVAGNAAAYKDHRIHLGIPEGSIDIKPEIDTLADMNLDKLNAVSWDKGCFVGQEVAARMENRGLVKKRMVIVSGAQLAAGEALTQNGVSVGDVRSVNTAGTEGLALLKLAALDNAESVMRPDKSIITARLPDWLKLENT